MKKFLSILTAGILVGAMATGCSARPEETGVSSSGEASTSTSNVAKGGAAPLTGVKLEFLYNLNGEAVSDAVQEVCEQFTYETGIEVEAIMPGSNFSDIMKTRMASQQLPDLWATHGWAVARYAEYLEPLNDLSFADHIMPGIQDMITDADGNLYTLPIDMDMAGIVYNVQVLEDAGVNPDEIVTWDDFYAACEKISTSGKTPIHVGGKDNWTIGNMLNMIAPTLLTNGNEVNQSALKDGSFDWTQWDEIGNLIQSWQQAGFINTDCITADYMTSVKAMAANEVAFGFYQVTGAIEAKSINPSTQVGFIPLPTKQASDENTLISGEHFAVGMWKDTEHPEEAKQFLEFLAREDICEYLATECGMPAGLDYVTADTGDLAPFYAKYIEENIATIPYFDRAYLPSGMWNDLCVTGSTVLSGKAGAVEEASAQMKQSYDDKLRQS